jgi:uncharacterized protein (DUF1330 family)
MGEKPPAVRILEETSPDGYSPDLGAVAVLRAIEDASLMAKAYWITSYRKVSDSAKLAAYAKLAGPALEAGGGRFLARGTAVKAYEEGRADRTVVIEFDSVEQAIATHDSPGYQAALAALEGGAERDVRIVSGV